MTAEIDLDAAFRTMMTRTDFVEMVENFRFHGFNRQTIVDKALSTIPADILQEFIVAGVFRGTNSLRYRAVTMTTAPFSGRTMLDAMLTYGLDFVTPAPQLKSDALTAQRLVSAFPELAFITLKCADYRGDTSSTLPGPLQFPAAASLPLSKTHRTTHRAWHEAFSARISIGGRGTGFNPTIYETMVANAGVNRLFLDAYTAAYRAMPGAACISAVKAASPGTSRTIVGVLANEQLRAIAEVPAASGAGPAGPEAPPVPPAGRGRGRV